MDILAQFFVVEFGGTVKNFLFLRDKGEPFITVKYFQ
jgi:hypothetical protein